MRIARLSARNIKGFETFDQELGNVNVIAGKNSCGKSSTLTLITALFGRLGEKGRKGVDPKILRAGATEGQIGAVIASDEGSETWSVDRRFLPGKVETPTVRSSVTGMIGSPVAFLEQLVDKVSIEPIGRAMNASEDEQVNILLATIPMKVSAKDVSEAAGDIEVPGLKVHLDNCDWMASGLDAIDAVHKLIFQHRTNVNRDAKQKDAAADELRASLPKPPAGEQPPTIDECRAHVRRLESQLEDKTNEETEMIRSFDVGLARAMQAETAKEAGDIRGLAGVTNGCIRKHEDRIRELEADITEQRRLIKNAKDAQAVSENDIKAATKQTIAALDKGYSEELQALSKRMAPQREELQKAIGSARAQVEAQVSFDGSLAIAARYSREAAELAAKSKDMTVALDRLDKLKLSLVGRLDEEIKGLRVERGSIAINGVPLSQLNTAEQAKFWIKVGARRAGELGVIACDGMECLDDQQFESVCNAFKGSGLQVFFGRVDSKEFRIEVR